MNTAILAATLPSLKPAFRWLLSTAKTLASGHGPLSGTRSRTSVASPRSPTAAYIGRRRSHGWGYKRGFGEEETEDGGDFGYVVERRRTGGSARMNPEFNYNSFHFDAEPGFVPRNKAASPFSINTKVPSTHTQTELKELDFGVIHTIRKTNTDSTSASASGSTSNTNSPSSPIGPNGGLNGSATILSDDNTTITKVGTGDSIDLMDANSPTGTHTTSGTMPFSSRRSNASSDAILRIEEVDGVGILPHSHGLSHSHTHHGYMHSHAHSHGGLVNGIMHPHGVGVGVGVGITTGERETSERERERAPSRGIYRTTEVTVVTT